MWARPAAPSYQRRLLLTVRELASKTRPSDHVFACCTPPPGWPTLSKNVAEKIGGAVPLSTSLPCVRKRQAQAEGHGAKRGGGEIQHTHKQARDTIREKNTHGSFPLLITSFRNRWSLVRPFIYFFTQHTSAPPQKQKLNKLTSISRRRYA